MENKTGNNYEVVVGGRSKKVSDILFTVAIGLCGLAFGSLLEKGCWCKDLTDYQKSVYKEE